MAEESYSLKEVIEKNFADLRSDMRTGFSDMKVDVKEVRTTAEMADQKSTEAIKRLNTYDKHIWLIWAALVAGIIKIVFDYLQGA